jgi:NAD(P)-dependent dehydrogenase (short-subunit alcohol dehydrogenase family)
MFGMAMVFRFLVLALALHGAVNASMAQTTDDPWSGLTVVVTGANRGLGLEFARQLTEAGATVIGTARRPEAATELKALGARVEQLDVSSAASVESFAERLGDLPIDVLLNNAGIFPSRGGLTTLDPDEALQVYAVNTIGPMRVTKALLDNLRAGNRKLIMNMSSGLGSIVANGRGGAMGYRESKAALNMFTRSIAAEFVDDGFTCIAMSPGWVRTDMGGDSAPLSPEESVRGMLSVLAGVGVDDSGSYFDYRGEELGW